MEIGQQYVPYNLFNSVFIPDGLMRHQGITLSAKVVWAVLNKYGGRRGIAWPSVGQISRDAAIPERSVARALIQLQECQLITRVGTMHKHAMWTFVWHECLECSVKESHKGVKTANMAGCHQVNTATVAGDDTNTATVTDVGGKPADLAGLNLPPWQVEGADLADYCADSNNVLKGSCMAHDNGSSSTRESESPPERPPGDDERDEVRSLFILLGGRVDVVDFQNLDNMVEDYGQEKVAEALQAASINKVRGRGVLPYAWKVLKNQGKVEANGGIDPDRDNWR